MKKRVPSRRLARLIIVTLLGCAALFPGLRASAAAGGGGVAPEDLLRVTEAFRLSTESVAPDMLRLTWEITDGYYLYRQRFKFVALDEGVRLGGAVFPAGKVKQDEFFGEVETYRHRLSVDVPVIADSPEAAAMSSVRLKVTSQGCADAGLCYPPHTEEVSIPHQFAAAPEAASDGLFANLSSLGRKFGIGNSQESEFLPPDQAFVMSLDVRDAGSLDARWQIAEGYYLYREKFGFDIVEGSGVTLGEAVSPAGEFKEDETFGLMEVYHDAVSIGLPLQRQNGAATDIMVEVRYQGCAEAGFCYPPITKQVPVGLPAATITAAASPASPAPPAAETDGFVSEQDRMAQSLASGNLLGTLALFYGAGLLLAFTPCVFPMVPILSSIIAGQGPQTTTRKAFFLSLAYVVAMALTYTAAGVIAGATGQNLQAAFQNPWIISAFSLLFVALAMSMFGFYELQLPASLQSRLTALSNNQQRGTLAGAGVMGFLSALIVGPCVAAPLAGALIYIGQTGDAALGGLALFALSMGMGTPLLVIGTSAGKLLPKAGSWMNTVKAVFGVLLLALAIWMLERIVPAQVALLLWATLAIVSAVYLGALRPLGPDAGGWQKLWQGTGLVLLVIGIIWILGAASGGRSMFKPLEYLSLGSASGGPSAQAAGTLAFKPVKGLSGLNRELEAARAQGRPVMLDFYADWCVSCKEMEHYTFSDAGVQAALQNVLLLQTDVTANDETDQALLAHFGLYGPPSIIFYDQTGRERSNYRVVGFMDADAFRDHVNMALR